MKARVCIAILAVLAMAVAGAFLVLDRDAPYASADASGDTLSGNIHWDLTEGVLTLSPNVFGGVFMDTFTLSGDGMAPWLFNADNRYSIAEVVVEDGITSIGAYAFYAAAALKSIDISNDVEEIGARAFYYCYALSSIVIPSGMDSIPEYLFRDNYSLTSVIIPTSVETIGNYAFYSCSSLGSIDIPSSVKTIGNYAFYGCSSMRLVHFINTSALDTIGEHAFEQCSHLLSIDIPAGVSSMGVSVFSHCTALASVTFLGSALTSIPGSTFGSCYSLSSIDLPSGVKTIGASAFSSCYSLSSIDLPSGVTGIAADAFKECRSLASIEIPSGVKAIFERTFQNCTSLTSVTFSPGSALEMIANYAFEYCYSLASIEIPSGVKYILDGAFDGCQALTDITIPGGVTSITTSAFQNCYSLALVTILGNVTSIQGDAFNGCHSLTSIVIPASVTSINARVFSGCTALRNITFLGDPTSINISTIQTPFALGSSDAPATAYIWSSLSDQGAVDARFTSGTKNNYTTILWGGSAGSGPNLPTGESGVGWTYVGGATKTLTFTGTGDMPAAAGWAAFKQYVDHVIIDNGVTSISDNAFKDFYSLVDVSIPGTVASIGAGAFQNCTSLTAVTLPIGVESIGNDAFSGCRSLVSIAIPSSVTSIGAGAFQNCSTIGSVTIPGGVATISDNAFNGCASLDSVTFSGNVGTIGAFAFYSCYSLLSVTFSGPVTSIGASAFNSCYSLASIDLSSVAAIGASAFYSCYSLASIDVSSATSIGASAFYGCRSLTSFAIPSGVAAIGASVFQSCTSLTSIVIPSNVKAIGASAFAGCTSLASVDIQNGVKAIEASAFYQCRSLSAITIPVSVTSVGAEAFRYCYLLASVVITDPDITLADSVFQGDYSLTAVSIYNPAASAGGGTQYNPAAISNLSPRLIVFYYSLGEPVESTQSTTGVVTLSGFTDSVNVGTARGGDDIAALVSDSGTFARDGHRVGYVTSSTSYDVTVYAGDHGTFGYEIYTTVPTGTLTETGLGRDGPKTIDVPTGEHVVIVSQPDSGYQFVKWEKTYPATATFAYDYVAVSSYGVYKVTLATDDPANGYNVAIDSGTNGDVQYATSDFATTGYASGKRTVHVDYGKTITLSALADADYVFASWTVGGAADASYEATIAASAAGEYEATWTHVPGGTYKVSVDSGANGTVQYAVSGSGPTGYVSGARDINVPAGETVTLTGVATTAGYLFEKWHQTAPVASTFSHNPIVVSSAGAYRVSFFDSTNPANGYNVTVTAGADGKVRYATSGPAPDSGEFAGTATVHVDAGETVALTGVALTSRYVFEQWTRSLPTAAVLSGNPIVVSLAGAYAASFIGPFYTLSASADSGSTITPSGTQSALAGSSVTFTFSAKAGYAIAGVTVDGASVPSAVDAGAYTFSGVASNHVISVASTPASEGITLAVSVAGGDGTPEYHVGPGSPYVRFVRSQPVALHSDLYVSVDVGDGYKFVGWTGDVTSSDVELHISDADRNLSLVAHLEADGGGDGLSVAVIVAAAAIAILVVSAILWIVARRR